MINRCIPFILGAASFLLVVGPRALYPTNIAWLEIGDPACYYLGWAFFRQTEWLLPLGLNPMYGLEMASSILYSDSNPLLAFLFKALDPLLPETFQYFGIWLLACFVLQAWFAWTLLGLATKDLALRTVASAFFLFAPPMLFRLHPLIGHLNLFAHFFILAALYLSLKPQLNWRRAKWACLLCCATLVHTYLLAMVAVLWISDLIARSWRESWRIQSVTLEILGLTTAIIFLLWQAGFFVVGETFTYTGYGRFRMNLLSPIDPGKNRYGMWSLLLPDLPGDEDQHEDFNFLGLGILVLVVIAIMTCLSGKGPGLLSRIKRYPILLCTLIGLVIFSISHKIGFGPWTLEVPLPPGLIDLANILRSSGRMFWPAFYAGLFLSIFIVARSFRPPVAVAILTGALAVQVIDTSPGWLFIRHHMMVEPDDEWETGMDSDFWAAAAQRYSKIRWMPSKNISPYWTALSFFSAKHGMATNAVYLARANRSRIFEQRSRDETMLINNTYADDTLYVFGDDTLPQVMENFEFSDHMLAEIDGAYVVAPNWNQKNNDGAPD